MLRYVMLRYAPALKTESANDFKNGYNIPMGPLATLLLN